MERVIIIGGGLSGCEVALQLSKSGISVELIDIKPNELLSAYKLKSYCELICNNSLGSRNEETPLGLLLAELEFLDSQILSIAKKSIIADSRNLSVDKSLFSHKVSVALKKSGVIFSCKKVQEIPSIDSPIIIATGALTDEHLTRNISKRFNLPNYFFADASCPVIDGRSINYNCSLLTKITNDLFILNIPKNTIEIFFKFLKNTEYKKFDDVDYYDSFIQCKSLEKIAEQGLQELIYERFSPDGYEQSPALLLRRESGIRDAFILVGCTTGLRHKEQINLFSILPALENIKFIRFASQHRNTYFRTPGILNSFFKVINSTQDIFIIGQLSGLDGYAPAIASGYIVSQYLIYPKIRELPHNTMIGALSKYVSNINLVDYQPMCASFSLLPQCNSDEIKTSSLKALADWKNNID